MKIPLLSSFLYLIQFPLYFSKEMIRNFFMSRHSENCLGHGHICNYPTMFVQKKFMAQGGGIWGVNFKTAMGYPYNFFAPPLRTIVLLKSSYQHVIFFNLLFFVLIVTFAGIKYGVGPLSLTIALFYVFSAYNVWYNVQNYMVFLFGLAPAFLVISSLVMSKYI